MSLINELQESAEKEDVQTVLRKAKRVSAKLGLRDISGWLHREQNGYEATDELPSYRNVPITFCYDTNGNVPAGYGCVMRGIVPLPGLATDIPMPVADSISTITSWLNAVGQGKGIYQPLTGEAYRMLRSNLKGRSTVLDQITLMAQMNEAALRDIPEHVKNKVLDWACQLEKAGVVGEGQSFTNAEKRDALGAIINMALQDFVWVDPGMPTVA